MDLEGEHEVKTLREQVSEFHRMVGHPISKTPRIIGRERMELRLNLIVEELYELLAAAGYFYYPDYGLEQVLIKSDLAQIADALADLDYVIEGMRLELGIDGKPIADLVHASNMAKRGATKDASGKVQKPVGWAPPDIRGELIRQGWKGDEK
jgi:predicted HAD superfamily Cof-like phosphohydrolase